MLRRLLSNLIGKPKKSAGPGEAPPPARAEAASPRGAAVTPEGLARPAVRVHVERDDIARIDVESNPELRSAALFQSHLLAEVSPAAMFELHRRYGRRLEAEVADLPPLTRRTDADPRRRIRIGYVSPNLGSHSVSYFIEPVLAHHDRTAFEVYCYHTGPHCDETTERIEASVDAWRQADSLSDDALAGLIVDDRIDVLVDLAGHTLFGRLAVFARRPAPVQMTWIGYPDTTGIEAMDFRITDAIADPAPQADALHTERLLRLPGAFLCYQPPRDAPEVELREHVDDDVVFCSFNTVQKVNDAVIELWSRVLRAVPASRLLIKGGRLLAEESVVRRIHTGFAAHGIPDSRLVLKDWIEDRADHLTLYGEADIALDTFPYNGTTTTCEAMWMGVPLVTLAGEAHMSRVGATLLSAIGLHELTAHSPDAFVEAAVSLAREVPRRRALRATLRQRLAASPLLDHAGFTRTLEAAIRDVWVEWCGRQTR